MHLSTLVLDPLAACSSFLLDGPAALSVFADSSGILERAALHTTIMEQLLLSSKYKAACSAADALMWCTFEAAVAVVVLRSSDTRWKRNRWEYLEKEEEDGGVIQ